MIDMIRLVHGKMAALSMALVLFALAGLNVAPWRVPSPFSLQDGQLCVRTACVGRDLRVSVYQTQPDLPSAPPSAWYASPSPAMRGSGK